MARGKQSLLELTAPENIIETNEEVGSIPFFDIDDEYAISGCYGDYALVIRKKASKTGKEENGEDNTKVYTYYRWDELKYDSKVYGIFDLYLKAKRLHSFKNMKRTNDIKELIKIEKEISDYVHNILDINTSEQFKTVCDLTDTVLFLKKQIEEARNTLSEYKKLIHDTQLEFKESKKLIVENMPKTKKHPIKEEE
ncbi:MAG: hypothetical protein K0S18_42 [Anaerocolumna sp.]|jgi:hypothetical protein|nr:hypothetical protein [Anaerocolumna sp.]